MRLQLKANKRELLGKSVKRLRRQELLPANLYGHKAESTPLKIELSSFRDVFSQTGETAIVDLKINDSNKKYHALIREVQRDPVSGELLHVDFQQVELTEEIESDIPVRLSGEPDLVRDRKAIVLQELNELSVKAPADQLPEEIEVNVFELEQIGQALRVKDLKMKEEVKVLTDQERVVARLDELVSEEAEELAEEEAIAAAEASAEAVVEEEETPEEAAPEETEEVAEGVEEPAPETPVE